ncbi:putative copper-transporting ATPase hma5, variant 2 [Trifolium repens]|nr:copper-transporting ATPase RAN1 [Trifolium repens]WJX18164.1 putative copper-transporting ATPase hma5, variant 2 [Trifolium repens]
MFFIGYNEFCFVLSSSVLYLQLTMWDLRMKENGGCVHRISGTPGDTLYSVCSSSTGNIAVGGIDRTVTIYDPRMRHPGTSLEVKIGEHSIHKRKGEARPVSKRKGDTAIGGTLNENDVLHVKATKVGSESALSQIVRLVESAQMAKAHVQKSADRISKLFVPLVILISFSTWLAWFLAGKYHAYLKLWIPSSMDSFELALQFGIFVMVIACPCALGLATPTAVMVGTGVGASQGVLIKGGQALEIAHKVNCIVFDKPGTLTIGKPVIVNTKLLTKMVLWEFYEPVAAADVSTCPSSPCKSLSLSYSYREQLFSY